tara:strand:- start:12 stop:962 length:951 start_codon:yes stop_codon:yes gene_type:complete
MANGLLSQYQVNPFQKPETMTQDQFNQSMTESYTRPKNPNTMYLSPTFTDSTQSIMTDYGPRQVSGKKLTGVTQSGADIAAAKKEIAAKEKAFAESGATVQSTLPDKGESLLPDPKLEGKSFMNKLQSGLDKIFNMQTDNPEAYAKMMSGIDLYNRSQTQDLATALLGNNKFNKDQAAALMISNKNAMQMRVAELSYSKSLADASKIDMPSEELTKLAQSRLKNEFDIKDENQGYALASKAMKELQKNPGLTQPEALTLAIMRAVENGELKSGKGKFGKGEFKSMIDVEITTQAEYDALPSGAIFTQPGVGRRRKP